jgi:hypothetical protein
MFDNDVFLALVGASLLAFAWQQRRALLGTVRDFKLALKDLEDCL